MEKHKQDLISDLINSFSEELSDLSLIAAYLMVEVEIRFGNLSRCAQKTILTEILIEIAEDKLAAEIFCATKLSNLIFQIERYRNLKKRFRILEF